VPARESPWDFATDLVNIRYFAAVLVLYFMYLQRIYISNVELYFLIFSSFRVGFPFPFDCLIFFICFYVPVGMLLNSGNNNNNNQPPQQQQLSSNQYPPSRMQQQSQPQQYTPQQQQQQQVITLHIFLQCLHMRILTQLFEYF